MRNFLLVALSTGIVIFARTASAQPEAAPTATITPNPVVIEPPPAGIPAPGTAVTTPTPNADVTPVVALTPPPEKEHNEASAVTSSSSFQWSERGAPVFTLDQAVMTALHQNPDLLRALQEIERTKGVIIQVRAEALPRVTASAELTWTDPRLNRSGLTTITGTTPTPTPPIVIARIVDSPQPQMKNIPAETKATTAPAARQPVTVSDTAYNIRITGQQLVFNYSTLRSIRGTFFQRDSAYFAFRNVVDQTIANVKTQFYQVLVNRALITVQEESVRLLESQLKDQQNRFEAGTVPRFNVLQAQVQLSNQIPNLIAARNNYRISILQLAKTLGLDFNPLRGIAAPIRVVGDLIYVPRDVSLLREIESGKQNRPFLKEARANVLNQIEQVHVALGGWFPNVNAQGGYEIVSSPLTTNFDQALKGWVFGLTGSWDIWDSGFVYGQVKQQRALLSESKITYDDDVRQVELEIQQAASNLLQNAELIQATEKNVEQADEAVRLAKARLDAGAGTQLDVLNAQVQLTTAQSTRLEALFGYNSSLAEFDRVTGRQSRYTEEFEDIAPHSTRTRTYYTGSDVNATGDPKPNPLLRPGPVTTTTTTRTIRASTGK
ncbi:MAG: TolC family protein [Chthoniobacterales bacterium]